MSHPGMLERFAPIADLVELIYYDQRGHGRSSRAPAATYTIGDQAEDLHALCEALRITHPVMLGASAGGFTALAHAGRYPDEPRALILIGTSPSSAFMARATANIERLGTPAMVAAYRSLWDGSLADPQVFKRAFETITPMYYHDKRRAPSSLDGTQFDPDTRRAYINDYPSYDTRPMLGRVRVPTLIAVGRHDWICPVEESFEIARLLPQAEMHIFEHSGHSPQVEERDAFMTVVRRFLSALPRA